MAASDSIQTQASTVNNLSILKMLGQGAFGKVFLTRKQDGEDAGNLYALKALRKANASQRRVKHMLWEKHILEQVEHPFIIKLKTGFETSTKFYLVMEFVRAGDLWSHMKRQVGLLEDQAKFYIGEMVLALEYLHARDIAHHDLKPENILMDEEGHIRLTDFGFSVILTHIEADERIGGTRGYRPPEVVEQRAHGKEVDWWALGICLHDLVQNTLPFTTDEHVLTRRYRPPSLLTRDAKGFLKKLLTKDPKRRMGYGPLGTANVKAHTFFSWTPGEWEDRLNKRVEPPYIPALTGEVDTNHFDSEYTDVSNPRDSDAPEPDADVQAYFEQGVDLLYDTALQPA